MASRYIKPTDLVLLWGRAGGCCSICKNDLLKEFRHSGNINLGEKAHIIPYSKNGPRGDGITDGETIYENLILVCGYHHTEIDKAAKDYPSERLLGIKKEHEKYVRNAIASAEKNELISSILTFLQTEDEPKIVPLLLIEGGRHHSYGALIPEFIQKILGGSFGFHRVGIKMKNIGSKRANRVTLQIKPTQTTMPKNYCFSTDMHVTRESMPHSFEKELSLGSINVGETKSEPCQFYLNYTHNAVADIGNIEFEYYLTCDDTEPSSGTLRIANA